MGNYDEDFLRYVRNIYSLIEDLRSRLRKLGYQLDATRLGYNNPEFVVWKYVNDRWRMSKTVIGYENLARLVEGLEGQKDEKQDSEQ